MTKKEDDHTIEMMNKVEAVLATGTLEDAGLVLAYLLGKWVSQLPAEVREVAMLDFSHRLQLSMEAHEVSGTKIFLQ